MSYAEVLACLLPLSSLLCLLDCKTTGSNIRGRHWINARNRDDLDLRNGADHFIGDRGRAIFQTENLSERCNQVQDASKECSFLETRKECPSTCGIYLDSSFYINNIFTGPNMTSKW